MGQLHHQGHPPLVRQLRLLPQPQAVVDCESVDCHRQALRVDLSELLASGVVLEVLLEHVLRHLLRPGPVDLEHLVRVGIVGVEAPEL